MGYIRAQECAMDTNLADVVSLGLLLHTKAPMSQL
jgi:hypothetical protein